MLNLGVTLPISSHFASDCGLGGIDPMPCRGKVWGVESIPFHSYCFRNDGRTQTQAHGTSGEQRSIHGWVQQNEAWGFFSMTGGGLPPPRWDWENVQSRGAARNHHETMGEASLSTRPVHRGKPDNQNYGTHAMCLDQTHSDPHPPPDTRKPACLVMHTQSANFPTCNTNVFTDINDFLNDLFFAYTQARKHGTFGNTMTFVMSTIKCENKTGGVKSPRERWLWG